MGSITRINAFLALIDRNIANVNTLLNISILYIIAIGRIIIRSIGLFGTGR
jgi:hypothetical protein